IAIPLIVMFLPFVDGWMTGPEKDIIKRPVILMTSIMALVSWVVFSFLIIFNIANIHTDPPYWRAFLYLTIDAGVVWQLWLFWNTTDPVQKARQVKQAMVVTVLGFIQTFWAVVYYYMAQTELFLSPVSQSFCYWLLKSIGAVPNADTLEAN